jgi:hypothetical protein
MKSSKFSKSEAIFAWLRRNWGVVFVLALAVAFIVVFMVGGMNFFEALRYTFDPSIGIFPSADRGGVPLFVLTGVVIVIVVVVALIVRAIMKRVSKK